MSVVLLTEKPMVTKANFGMDPSETEKEMGELKKKLDTLTAIPKKKYPFPMTANQEIGWETDDVRLLDIDICSTLTFSDQSTTIIRLVAQKLSMHQTM